MKKRRITLVITGDSNYDQRLQKVCNTLLDSGYDVTLISFKKTYSKPLVQSRFKQIRLKTFFKRGILFYAEANARILFCLISRKQDIITANDVETLMPVFLASKLRGCKRIADMHEYFTEMPEMLSKPSKRKGWLLIESTFLPVFKIGYTVTPQIAKAYQNRYGLKYEVIYNYPKRRLQSSSVNYSEKKFILYQGAVVQGRCFEEMISATKITGHELVIAGNGGQFEWLVNFVKNGNHSHVQLLGYLEPRVLRELTVKAWLGLNLLSSECENQRLTATNRFFDYIQAGLPQISSSFAVYEEVNRKHEVSVLLDSIEIDKVVTAIRKLENPEFHESLRQNALLAAEIYTWESQQNLLTRLYQGLSSRLMRN